MDSAIAFWGLLLPVGLKGGALSHRITNADGDEEPMDGQEPGWKPEYTDWWFEFMQEKGGKGVSKDTWAMVSSFIFSRLVLAHFI